MILGNLTPSRKAPFDCEVACFRLYKGFNMYNDQIKLYHDVLKLTYGIVKI